MIKNLKVNDSFFIYSGPNVPVQEVFVVAVREEQSSQYIGKKLSYLIDMSGPNHTELKRYDVTPSLQVWHSEDVINDNFYCNQDLDALKKELIDDLEDLFFEARVIK